MTVCEKCGKRLSYDEVGLYKKTVNRFPESYLCISCLAEKFKTTEEALAERIEFFKKNGCTLFSK